MIKSKVEALQYDNAIDLIACQSYDPKYFPEQLAEIQDQSAFVRSFSSTLFRFFGITVGHVAAIEGAFTVHEGLKSQSANSDIAYFSASMLCAIGLYQAGRRYFPSMSERSHQFVQKMHRAIQEGDEKYFKPGDIWVNFQK